MLIKGLRPSQATLHVDMENGVKYDVRFETVQTLDFQHGIYETVPAYGYKQYAPSGVVTLSLVGRAVVTQTIPASKSAAPPKKKLSTIACAKRAKKAAALHARLAKQISVAEQVIAAMKAEKELCDVELKTAREQLLASAS